MNESWVEVSLGDVSDVNWGDTKTTKSSYTLSGHPAFSASGPDGFLPRWDYDRSGVVVSAIGAQCGKTWYASGRWSCIKNTIRILASDGIADDRFLFYVTSRPNFFPARGSAQPFIAQSDARAVRFLLPPLNEQRKLAGVLGAMDDLIEVNRRLKVDSVELAKALIAQADVEQRVPLSDIAIVSRGLSYKGSGLVTSGQGLPMANMGCAENFGWLKREGWKYYAGDYKDRHVAVPGDLLVVNTEQTWKNEIIGWPLLVPADVPKALFTHHVYKVQMKPGWEWARLAVWGALYSREIRAVIDGSVRGTTVANLPVDAMEKLIVPLPGAQNTVLDAASNLLKSAWANEIEVSDLAATRDQLLPLLMSGRVRVGDVAA
jgi:hypothetical protein